ncbi:MAG: hypothetical protein GY788_08040 [bacterium]|nr:hypothetical protein [bacterium]
MADRPSPLENAVLQSFPWLVGGLLISIPLLLIPTAEDRRTVLLIHLAALVVFSLGLTWKLAPLSGEGWYPSKAWKLSRSQLAGAVSLIIVVTGVTALVTLASSAALRFQPSLQFLQLLSALDIAWVVSGTTLATRSLWGRGVAIAAGIGMSIICVMSIALYLAEVGLDESGGWLVDSSQMLRLVLPFDVAAAVLTIGLTLLAASLADGTGQIPVV